MKPYVVQEVRHKDGRIDKFYPEEIRRILDKRSASLLSGMLVSVVDNGHSQAAKVDGYYVAGKTGTAQIASVGGYGEETNHSFIGFAPVDNPKFVILIKFEKPYIKYASISTTPVFHDMTEFLLKYYQIPPER